ncbi:hypothetical protein KQX54_017123 [Cotesia glomerata]|uniref:Uncharacterized protein n=1 Tax=Cotesia glomerata TaxID=32391 RepID=A0AAV7IXF3_COTGL|nr:hypothetical protein KQX54_017123 [Cotesia glomerata]
MSFLSCSCRGRDQRSHRTTDRRSGSAYHQIQNTESKTLRKEQSGLLSLPPGNSTTTTTIWLTCFYTVTQSPSQSFIRELASRALRRYLTSWTLANRLLQDLLETNPR